MDLAQGICITKEIIYYCLFYDTYTVLHPSRRFALTVKLTFMRADSAEFHRY